MRFACEQCQTKYSIPDERVRGKILKIRCKNCSCLISVSESGVRAARPAESFPNPGLAGLADPGTEGGDSTMIGIEGNFLARPATLPSPSDEDEWHLSIDGSQNGPMQLRDLAQHVLEQAGSSAELFVWKDGFDGWKAVETVPEIQAAVEKVRGGGPRAALSAQAAPRAGGASSAAHADGGEDATQIGTLNLPADLGKLGEDEVQDASMLSLEPDAFEEHLPKKPQPTGKPPMRSAAPPPFKAPPQLGQKPPAPPLKPPPPSGRPAPVPGATPPALAAPPPAAKVAEAVPAAGSLLPAARTAAAEEPNSASAEPSVMSALDFSGPAFTKPQEPPPKPPLPAFWRSKSTLGLALGLLLFAFGGGYLLLTRAGKPIEAKVESSPGAGDAGTSADGGRANGGAMAGLAKPESTSASKKDELAGIKEDEYKALLEAGEDALSKCYAKALKKDDSLAGKVLKAEVEVSAKGKPSEVKLEGPESDGKLGKCVEKAVKKWKFQKGEDKKPYTIRFPLPIKA